MSPKNHIDGLYLQIAILLASPHLQDFSGAIAWKCFLRAALPEKMIVIRLGVGGDS
jgi:hypothetical protein